jgi:hypothetical protein
MSNHTAQDLLEAVGVTSETHNHLFEDRTGAWCVGLRPPGADIYEKVYRYTGPALGTPELDAVLLVEGVKLCRDNWQLYQDVNDAIYKLNETEIDATDTFALEWLLFHCDQPGERLARAIWAAMKRGEK